MSKKIRLSNDEIESILNGVREQLNNNVFDDNVKISYKVPEESKTARLIITCNAYAKMKALVDDFTTEVQWHATAHRVTTGDAYEKTCDQEFVISDVLMFPQTVTGGTVRTDQEKYEEWLDSQEDDVFNEIRMHGHSHVNFSTSPSGLDLEVQEKIVKTLPKTGENSFYIFMIINKKGEFFVRIYDALSNTIFEKKDIDVVIEFANCTKESFLKEAHELAVTPPQTQTKVETYKTSRNEKKKNNNYKSNYLDYDEFYNDTEDDLAWWKDKNWR